MGTRFTGRYTDLDKTKRYYIRSFGVNEYGFAYGNDLVVENAGLDTATIPCHPGTNVARSYDPGNGITYADERLTNIGALDPLTREFEARGNSILLRVKFGKSPIGGVYTTSVSATNGSNNVEVEYSRINGTYELPAGSKVYVWQVDAATIKVWICDARVTSNISLTANMVVRVR